MSRRGSLESKSAQAEQVLTNPAFEAAFNVQREDFIRILESTVLETADAEQKALSNVRDLQALLRMKTALVRAVKAGDAERERSERSEASEEKEPYHPSNIPTPQPEG